MIPLNWERENIISATFIAPLKDKILTQCNYA